MLTASSVGWFLLPGSARAGDLAGSDLGSYQLSATAAGLQGSYTSPGSSSATAEGELPYAQSQLDSTPFGEGIASIAWPGAIPASAGTTAVVLGAPIPNNYADDLNDPVRAQAETGTDQPQVTNDSYPGTTMAASATGQQVTAEGDVDSAAAPAGGFSTGKVSSASSAALTGAQQAVVAATSQVTDLSLAGGLMAIRSVVSNATATTNGVTAGSTGSTVISGVTVAGVPATIDQNGLHLASMSDGVTPAAVAAANQAVAAAQLQVLPGKPVRNGGAGDAGYTAASVLIMWSPGGSGLFTVDLGGTSVSAAATAGFGILSASASPSSTGGFPAGALSTTAASGAPPGSSGEPVASPPGSPLPVTSASGTEAPASEAGPVTPAARPAGASPNGTSPGRSGQTFGATLASVSRPVSAGWTVLAILGSLCVAVGLAGVPDRLLREGGRTCKLEELG